MKFLPRVLTFFLLASVAACTTTDGPYSLASQTRLPDRQQLTDREYLARLSLFIIPRACGYRESRGSNWQSYPTNPTIRNRNNFNLLEIVRNAVDDFDNWYSIKFFTRNPITGYFRSDFFFVNIDEPKQFSCGQTSFDKKFRSDWEISWTPGEIIADKAQIQEMIGP